MDQNPLSPALESRLAGLGGLDACDTRHEDFALWVMQHSHDKLLAMLRAAHVPATDPVCALLAQCVFQAALAIRCVRDAVPFPEAQLAVFALAVNRLLALGDDLPRRAPPPFAPSPEQLDALYDHCEAGNLSTAAGGPLLDAVRAEALARLSAADALLVALQRALSYSWERLPRAFDLAEPLAKTTLAGAWRRYQMEMLRVAEDHLARAGRVPPARYRVRGPSEPEA